MQSRISHIDVCHGLYINSVMDYIVYFAAMKGRHIGRLFKPLFVNNLELNWVKEETVDCTNYVAYMWKDRVTL